MSKSKLVTGALAATLMLAMAAPALADGPHRHPHHGHHRHHHHHRAQR